MSRDEPKPESPVPRRRLVLALTVLTGLVIVAAIAGNEVGRYFGRSDGCGQAAVLHFAAGQRLLYHVNFDTASASNFGAIFSQASSQAPQPSPLGMSHLFDASLQCNLAVTVLEADAMHVALAYQFRDPHMHFQADGIDDAQRSETIQTGLMPPVFCLLDERGRVQSVEFDAGTNSIARHLVCTLLAAMQIVAPGSDANSAWQWDAEEEDPNGKFKAHYEMNADGTIHKTKPRYLPAPVVKKARTIRLSPTIQSTGEYVDTLDADHHLVAVSAAETQLISIQNREVGHSLLKLEMILLQKQEALPSELAQLRTASIERAKTTAAVRLYEATSPEQAEQNIQRQALGSETLESLLASLATTEAGSPSENEITTLFLKFKALAYIQPESCARLGELLASAKTGSLRMRILTDALQSAGNAPAQDALCSVTLSRTADSEAMRQLIPALGWIESPTPQTLETLQLLAFGMFSKDINTAARLALGGAVRNLGDESPSRAMKIVDRILQELNNGNAADSWELLLALGNAGSLEALPTLKQYLSNSEPNLRGAAAWAMRWIDSPDVDPLLTKILMEEPRAATRLEIVRALRFREKTAVNLEAQASALSKDSDPQVRIELLNNLWDARESFPKAKQLVEQAAADDASEAVRQAAAKMMEAPQPVQ